MLKIQKYIKLSLLCLLFTFILFGCKRKNELPDKELKDFSIFVDEIFITEVQQDTLTLNYSLANPLAYGITNPKTTLGHYSVDYINKVLIRSENYLSTLKLYDYDSLTESEQLTYDILKKDLELELQLGEYILYTESLGPTTGIQAQLPILLAEYNFYKKSDIDTYIKLLPLIYDYFKEIIAFEKEKSNAGLFMSDQVVDNIINQCNNFIKGKEDNYLITIFDEKISHINNLSEEEISTYKEKNKDGVINYIIPAYEYLIAELTKLKGTGTNTGGLAHFEKGKEYYEYLIATNTGSSKTIPELRDMLDKSISTNLNKLSSIIASDPSVYEKALNPSFQLTNPEEIVEYLKVAIERDFPAPPNVNYSIKYVHKSLQEHLSPAMYLIPAVDNYQDNIIYINDNPSYDLTQIFPTIAHEGYPGHLYQSVYFRDKNPAAIRNLLSFGGYVEGWATYVEYYSYYLAGFKNNLAGFLEANMAANMALYCRLDMGIHYDGWSLQETADYLKKFGLTDEYTIKLLYTTMIEEPGLYPQYGIGYLEIMELKNTAMNELGTSFNIKDFHTFILDIGPAPFDIINNRLNYWIKDTAKK